MRTVRCAWVVAWPTVAALGQYNSSTAAHHGQRRHGALTLWHCGVCVDQLQCHRYRLIKSIFVSFVCLVIAD